MDARDVIEFGAVLSAHAAPIIESPTAPDGDAVLRTWQVSRDRVSGWLKRLHDATESTAPEAVQDVLAVGREMLVGDVPARCWAAILAGRANRTRDVDLESVARNMLLARLRARRLVLQWLLDDSRVDDGDLAAIDRLRRRTERWTDMLTAPLVTMFGLEEFAFDVERSADFAREGLAMSRPGAWSMLLTGIRSSFDDLPEDHGRIQVANRRFVRSILACLPVDAFHPDGPFRSVRLARIRRGEPLTGIGRPSGIEDRR